MQAFGAFTNKQHGENMEELMSNVRRVYVVTINIVFQCGGDYEQRKTSLCGEKTGICSAGQRIET